MTPDLALLRDKLASLRSLVDALELELVDDPAWPEPSDVSYLNDADRKNPDIMSNVEAMTATNALIAWFGRDGEGYLGLWRGPRATPLAQAPIVRLDTEGQYQLVAATVGDYLAHAVDDDDFAQVRRTLTAAGFAVADSPAAALAALEPFDPPSDHRHVLYNAARARRGLAPIP